MDYRTLGTHGPRVSRLGLGGVTFGREVDEATSFALLDHAVERGVTLVDTAEAYGPPLPDGSRSHASERIIGRWLASRGPAVRERVVIETKLLPPLAPERIAAGVDTALARLQVDAIDLFLFHAPDPKTPIAESLGAVRRAVDAGKVRGVGLSNVDAPQATAAIDANVLPIAVVQTNLNLAVPDALYALIPLCAARGVGVQTYSPLGAGFLTGKYAAGQPPAPGTRFDVVPGHADVYFHPDAFARAARLGDLAVRTGIARAELAIAWVLRHAAVDNVLIGARSTSHIDAALAARELKWDAAWDAALITPTRSSPAASS